MNSLSPPFISFFERGKFYPKKVIQIGGVKLPIHRSRVKFLIQKSYPKKYYPKTYLTYFTLLYTQKAITQKFTTMRLILPSFFGEKIISQNLFTLYLISTLELLYIGETGDIYFS